MPRATFITPEVREPHSWFPASRFLLVVGTKGLPKALITQRYSSETFNYIQCVRYT